MSQRTALVTGASSGIGLAVARQLVERGYTVVGTCRNPSSLADKVAGVDYRALDLTDGTSIEAFAADLPAVDVLVNNAGESQSGPIEELPTEAIQRLFQLNVFGPVRLMQLLLPGMRERGYGRVVMIGSMIASFPLAYRSSYAATKAAIKGFATAARFELSPFGVWVTTVEPGSINTGISQRRTKYIADDSVHVERFTTMLNALDSKESTGITADTVASTVLAAIEAKRPKPFYAVGSSAQVLFPLKRILPRSTAERVTNRAFGLRP